MLDAQRGERTAARLQALGPEAQGVDCLGHLLCRWLSGFPSPFCQMRRGHPLIGLSAKRRTPPPPAQTAPGPALVRTVGAVVLALLSYARSAGARGPAGHSPLLQGLGGLP